MKTLIILLLIPSIACAVSVRSIDFTNGIKIEGSCGLGTLDLTTAFFPSVSDANALSVSLTSTCQRFFETSVRLSSFPKDDPVRDTQIPLPPNQRRAGGNLITSHIFIAVHVFNYPVTSSSDYTVRCSRLPITGNWWQ